MPGTSVSGAVKIRPATKTDASEWVRMRTALWPESPDDHPVEVEQFFAAQRDDLATFVAETDTPRLCGFIEAGTRPYAEGCLTSPVGYIEGWWVDSEHRNKGIGAALVTAAEDWARALGLTEMASDADLANDISQLAHRALDYEAAQRIVCFRKDL